jgi:hypothetical protein
MTGPECDNDMNHHHARVSCHGDQISHARDRIGGLRGRHESGERIDLIIHHQQRGAPRIDVRKLRHGLLLANEFSYDLPLAEYLWRYWPFADKSVFRGVGNQPWQP